MKRIGMLTSGGDCQGLNPALRGLAKALYHEFDGDVEIYGFADGYRGLIEDDHKVMEPEDFSGILTRGGTILGTSRQPFKLMRKKADDSSVDKIEAMKKNYKKLRLDALVILGGNGTHKTANLLHEEGLHIVTMPKTIDNDIWGTDMTFGFQSAVDVATNVIDCIHRHLARAHLRRGDHGAQGRLADPARRDRGRRGYHPAAGNPLLCGQNCRSTVEKRAARQKFFDHRRSGGRNLSGGRRPEQKRAQSKGSPEPLSLQGL